MSRGDADNISTELQELHPKNDLAHVAMDSQQPFLVRHKKRACCSLFTTLAVVTALIVFTIVIRALTIKEVYVRRVINPSLAHVDASDEQILKWAQNLGTYIFNNCSTDPTEF